MLYICAPHKMRLRRRTKLEFFYCTLFVLLRGVISSNVCADDRKMTKQIVFYIEYIM